MNTARQRSSSASSSSTKGKSQVATPPAVPPQTPEPLPAVDDRKGWRAHWAARGQLWRTEPEIEQKRQAELAQCRSLAPDTEKKSYPFKGMKLKRADVEWLLATHENDRGPVDWNNESQRRRQGLDLRGADLRHVDLRSLPLAGLCGGLTVPERVRGTEEHCQAAAILLEGANLSEAHLENAYLYKAQLGGANFQGASLTSANLSGAQLTGTHWREAHLEGADLSEAQLNGLDLSGAYLPGMMLNGMHLEGVTFKGAHLEGALLHGTYLNGVQLQGAFLTRANLSEAHLDFADLSEAHLENAFLQKASLEKANLNQANLARANLTEAHLAGASLVKAHLEESVFAGTHCKDAIFTEAFLQRADLTHTKFASAHLGNAHLEGAYLSETQFDGAYLRGVFFDRETQLINIAFGDERVGVASLSDVRWGDTSLAVVDWPSIRKLGDEIRANGYKNKRDPEYLRHYRRAVRANRQLAVALQAQGLNEDAMLFAYRAQVLQKRVWLSRMAQQNIRLRQRAPLFGAWLFSWFLFLIAGYGYKVWRSFFAYLLVIGTFVAIYLRLDPHLAWYEALVVSMTAFHGRGFSPSTFSPGDPLSIAAAIEAFVGLIIEVTFIATLTQRFFNR
ncbi:MAG TPA: pentapeptide repeat-containing protein [Ktedonobacteraceae bacterium]|nr:pentapeptide repeat-containing protein [Ktedonobacteraceae bacterium]